ncbi:hypothetical protein BDFB_008054 [Asbolus verrucosus]|uniref:Uncharacterized protein n=1 Tax=Asbolus verrucosus TaxID=1661398 RepID=A0A482VBM7_ASBVE|nr:hypothetical protein BDFB_008054 [Asbolus verrucosus]
MKLKNVKKRRKNTVISNFLQHR